MKAYVISALTRTDEEGFKSLGLESDSAALLKRHHGRHLTAGQQVEWFDLGDFGVQRAPSEDKPQRIGIMEFPSLDDARAWVSDPDFAEINKKRAPYVHFDFVLVVDGFAFPGEDQPRR
jgi:uncharacterized protein (DUF1330 family)